MVKLVKGSSTVIMNTCFQGNTLIKSIDCRNVQFLWIDESDGYWYHNNAYLAFADCTNLVSVSNINDNTINMDNMFSGCTSLTTLDNFPSSVIYLNDTFSGCTSLVSVPELPENVEEIGGLFYGCTSLTTSPVIPENVIWMKRTFYGCTNLTGDIYILSEDVEEATECFKNCGNLPKYVHVPKDSTTYQTLVDEGYKDDGSVEGVYLINGESQNVTLTINVAQPDAEVIVGSKIGYQVIDYQSGSLTTDPDTLLLLQYAGTKTDEVLMEQEVYDEEVNITMNIDQAGATIEFKDT